MYDQVAEDLRSGRLTLFRQAATQATEDEPMLPGAISAGNRASNVTKIGTDFYDIKRTTK